MFYVVTLQPSFFTVDNNVLQQYHGCLKLARLLSVVFMFLYQHSYVLLLLLLIITEVEKHVLFFPFRAVIKSLLALEIFSGFQEYLKALEQEDVDTVDALINVDRFENVNRELKEMAPLLDSVSVDI